MGDVFRTIDTDQAAGPFVLSFTNVVSPIHGDWVVALPIRPDRGHVLLDYAKN